MSSYKVFKHPEKGFEAVKSGFAWLAPFNPVWPLFRGLWALFITYIFYYTDAPSIKYIINDKNSNIIPTYNLLSSLDKILIIIYNNLIYYGGKE